MAIIKKFSPFQNLSSFSSFINDTNPNSQYFRISEFSEQFTGGKNGFLIEGSEFLKEGTEVKIEILDVNNNPVYFEPGDGVPEYYEGTSKLVSVHVYEDTPIGIGKITILGELKTYLGTEGELLEIPEEWKGVYNVKWEQEFKINKNLSNENIVRFYKRPLVNITELVKPVFSKSVVTKTDLGKVFGSALIPPVGTDLSTWTAGTSYELVRKKLSVNDTGSFDSDIDGNTITIYASGSGNEILHTAKVIEVVNDTTLIVDKPYTDSNGIVQNFPIRNPLLPSTNDYNFSASYDDIENETIGETSIIGSFAKIDISQLKTFVGDVARVKIFRKSRNAVGDYQFVQEAKLESQELLRDVTTSGNTEILYGNFNNSNLENYWVTSSDWHSVTVDSSKLNRAAKIDFDNSIVRRDHPSFEYGENYTTNYQKLYTSESISVVEGNEYALSFKTLISSSVEGDLSSWFGIQYNEASESYSTTQSLESASLWSGSYGSGDSWPRMYQTSGSFTENSGSNGFVNDGYYKLTWSSGSESFSGVWKYMNSAERSTLGRLYYDEGPVLSQYHTPQFVPFRNTFQLTSVDANGTDHYLNLKRTTHQEWNESTSQYDYLSQPDEYDGPTSWSLHVEKGTYYTGSENNYLLTASLSSSDFIEDFLVLSGSVQLQTKQDITKNIIAKNTGDAKLRFDVRGADWYISNVSIRNAQETSFSPDEFTIIQDIPRKTAIETFDFKFEFYDINNNFIPVEVLASKEFDGGNDFPTSGKLLTFESDRNAFRFSSGSIANPPNQTLQFKSTRQNLTGSLTFVSQAFDVGGNLITSQSYHDSGALVYGSSWTGSYPGLLTSITPVGALITIANFSGSLDTPTIPSESIIRVGSIIYTASLENVQEFETVFRLEDGDNAPQLIVTSNANQFIYEPTTLSPKPSGQSITVRAQRKNLASLITPIEVNSGSNLPELTYVSTAGGIDTYTISATEFSQSFASNNFDNVTYSFTGSDVFGNNQSDEITLSKVINFDAVSLVLSNDSTSFSAKSTGEVTGGFAASSGSVQMFIGNTQITHDDYDSDSSRNRNTFDIKTITATNVTATDTSPNTANYSISAFETSKDSGSLTLDIEYLAGDNITSQSFQKIVSYTKSKKAVPNVLTKTSPSTQTINSGSSGFEVPQTIEVVVQEGGTEYSYQDGLSGGDSETYKFQINGVLSGSNSNEIITPDYATSYATPASYIGTIGSASISYVDSEGTFVENKNVRFDISVSKTGVDGDPAKAVKLKTDRFIIKYDDYGNVTGSNTIGLTGSAQGYGTPEYQFLQNDTEIQAFSTTNTIEIPTDSGSLPAVDGTAFFEVRAREQGQSYTNVDDELEVYGVGKGRIYTVFFTNETHNFPADEFGNLKDGALENGSTGVRFYKNIDGILTEFTYDQNSPYGNNTFRTGSSSPSDFDGITVSGSTLPDGRLKYTPTAVTALQGGFEIGFIDNADTSNNELDRQYTFSIAEDGIKFKDLEIDISDGGNFIKPESGSYSPEYLQIDVIKSNITGSVTWTFGQNLYAQAVGGSTTTTGDRVYARYTDFVSSFNSGTTKFPITASLTNSEDSVVYADSDSIKVLQDGSSAITVDVSNPFEDVISTNGGFVGDYTDTGTDIQVFQGADLLTFTTGTAGNGQYTISTSISPASSIQLGAISGNGTTTFTISDHDDIDQDEDKVTITYTASGKRFDGTSFSRTGQQKIVKVKDAKPPISPTSLRVSDSLDSTPFDGSPGTTGTPTISNTHYGLWNASATAITTNTSFVNIGYLGLGASLTSDNNFSTDMKVYCQRTLEIGDTIVLYQDADNYGNYTVAAKTNADGSGDTVLQLTFVSSAGTLTVQSLDYIGFGRELVGPGVVYRGEYDSGTTYYYSETRRDIVEYSSTYYLASNPSDSGTSNWGTPGSSTDWEEFGAEFSSVATDILFAQDVYANRTINIGSDGSNPVIALNSDHGNSNANPSIAIGAATYEGAGIFLGYDSGTAKASLVNSGGTRHLKWDGSNLDIKGSITITGGSAQSALNSINSTTQSLQDDVSSLDGAVSQLESVTSSLENPTSYTFNPNNLDSIGTPGQNGLHLGDDKMGYYNSGWKTYMDSSGRFYLGGTGGALQWNGSNLNIEGSITITGGPAASSLSSLNSATESLDNSVSSLNSATQSLQNDINGAQDGVDAINATTGGLENPTSYDFGPSATFALDNVPDAPTNTAGLYLGQQYLGYHDGTDWKTFISSSGDAFFEGIVSGSTIQGGTITIGGGDFFVDSEGFLSASNASIGGRIITSDAELGGWIVDENAITSNEGNVILNATDEYIQVNDSNGVPRATLSTDTSLPTPDASGTSVSQTVTMSTQTRDVGPPTGLGNTDSDSGTLTHALTSFSTNVAGNHSLTFTYDENNGNQVSATGAMSSATMTIRVKIYSSNTYASNTLIATIGTWSISAYGNDTEGGYSSVIGNTKILLSNGFIKKAKDITKNDKLKVWDYRTNQYVESKIKSIHKRIVNEIYKVTLSNGLIVEVSDTHGFWLDNNEQIFATELVEGQSKIYIKDNNDISLQLVAKVELIETEEEVFTFRIPKYENYVSNGIVSHNPIGDSFPNNQTTIMTQPQTRTTTVSLANSTTYYPRIEASYDLVTTGFGSNDAFREASLTFNHDGTFSVNSVSAGMTTNAGGFQVNSNDEKVFRLDTNANDYDPFATLIGNLTIDGLVHGIYLPMDTSTAIDASYDNSGYTRAKLDLGTYSYAAGRAQCTVTFNESTSVATLQNGAGTLYACVNVDGISFTNINSNYSQNLRINFITGHNSYKWTPLVMSYGRTNHSSGNDADGLAAEESVNNHAARISGTGATTYCDITIRDNDGNGVRVPEELNFVALG